MIDVLDMIDRKDMKDMLDITEWDISGGMRRDIRGGIKEGSPDTNKWTPVSIPL